MDSTSTTVWGIDLGTTYSCIARVDESGRPVVVNNRDGDPTTPSVVMFADGDRVEVGRSAKQQMQLEPDLVCQLVKHNMGDRDWRFRAHGKEWAAYEVSSFILRALADDAKLQSGVAVERVVITVPAYFGVAEREATIAAGELAGLKVEDVINEPTAAAFCYGFAKAVDSDETVLVYDLGGGTFDVAVVKLATNEGGRQIRVVERGGDERLGGALWDARIVKLLAEKFQEQLPEAADPLDDDLASADLRLNAEDVKRALSARDSVSQVVMTGTDRANVNLTRDEFEAATNDLLEQTIDFTRTTVERAAVAGAPTIDRVLLVGGSSFMPAVSRRLQEAFPGWVPELQDPNQAVAKGAALAGWREALRLMIAALPGTGLDGTPTAGQVDDVFLSQGVSPAEGRNVVETDVKDVCSRGFGMSVLRDGHDPLSEDPADFEVAHFIERSTQLPVNIVKSLSTTVDDQTVVRLCVMEQTSREPTEDLGGNRQIEEGLLKLTRAYPSGTPIQVTLSLQTNGTLTIKAVDPDGGEIEFYATTEGAVISAEQFKQSQRNVEAVQLVV